MEQTGGYPIRPMTVKGVLAISMRLYRSGAGRLFWYLLPRLGLPVFAILLCEAKLAVALLYPAQIGSVPGGYGADMTALYCAIGMLAAAAVLLFWTWPTSGGVLYAEMAARMDGRTSRLSALRAAGADARFLYGRTFGAMTAAALLTATAAAGCAWLLTALLRACGVPMPWSAAISTAIPAAAALFMLFLLPLRLVFPAAAYENVRGFSALRRAVPMAWKRIGRILACTLCTLPPLLLGALLVTAGAYALAPGRPLLAATAASAVILILTLLILPYYVALDTVLFCDAAARERMASRDARNNSNDSIRKEHPIKEAGTPMATKRENIDAKLKWRLEDIYASDEAWEQDFQKARAAIEAFKAYQGRVSESADLLYETMTAQSGMSRLIERLFIYARMRRDEDNGNTKYQGMSDRAMQLGVTGEAVSAFVVPEILAIPSDTLKAWASEERFTPFRFELSDINRQRAHRLSAAEERILALAAEPLAGADNIFTMLSDVDLSFGTVTDENGKEVKLTHGSYGMLLNSPDRRVRRDAYNGIYSAYRSVQNTVAATYATSVKSDSFQANARGFDGALESALFGNNVPVAVYEQLIEAVHEKLPVMKQYLELKKKCLGVEQLEMYDLYTPMVPDCDIPMTYEEAKSTVKEALAPLGEHYGKLLDEAYRDGWIDVVETPGKTSGAYSWGVYGVHPFVLLNHQDNVDHAFTLAHELGHAMHSYHSNAAQPYETAEYRTMVAEVASTVNEVLMMKHLLKKETDRTRRAYLLNQFVEQFRTTCFRQTMFAEFEMKAHRMLESGEPLTVESLSEVYRALNEKYYPGVVCDDNIAIEWMRIPHFYRAFYVYQYATGICTAVALATDILEHGALDRYLTFLSSGGSDYPINLLKNAGVDLTDKRSILSSLDVFEDCVRELAELLQ